MSGEFWTLPNDAEGGLQTLAKEMLRDLRSRGYRVKIEPQQLDLPGTPTCLAKRDHETLFVLVRTTFSKVEIQRWVGYAQACSGDTRLAICSPLGSKFLKRVGELPHQGIGVVRRSETALEEIMPSRDLAFHAKPPARSTLRPKVRRLLGGALDKYERGDWREGFEAACTTLENECVAYLLRGRKLRPGRVTYIEGSKEKTPTEKQIRRMTMGTLKKVFCNLKQPTPTDSMLCAALGKVDKDRNNKVHNPKSKRTERALRTRVGQHFFLISNALELII